MRILWRSDALINEVGREVRLVDVDGDKVFEASIPESDSFLERVGFCIKYLFSARPKQVSIVMADDEFKDMCEKVVRGGIKDC